MAINKKYRILYTVLAENAYGKYRRAAPKIREPFCNFKSAVFGHAKWLQGKQQKLHLPDLQSSQQARTPLEWQNFTTFHSTGAHLSN